MPRGEEKAETDTQEKEQKRQTPNCEIQMKYRKSEQKSISQLGKLEKQILVAQTGVRCGPHFFLLPTCFCVADFFLSKSNRLRNSQNTNPQQKTLESPNKLPQKKILQRFQHTKGKKTRPLFLKSKFSAPTLPNLKKVAVAKKSSRSSYSKTDFESEDFSTKKDAGRALTEKTHAERKVLRG